MKLMIKLIDYLKKSQINPEFSWPGSTYISDTFPWKVYDAGKDGRKENRLDTATMCAPQETWKSRLGRHQPGEGLPMWSPRVTTNLIAYNYYKSDFLNLI